MNRRDAMRSLIGLPFVAAGVKLTPPQAKVVRGVLVSMAAIIPRDDGRWQVRAYDETFENCIASNVVASRNEAFDLARQWHGIDLIVFGDEA